MLSLSRLLCLFLLGLSLPSAVAQKLSGATSDFIVLRADRITVWASTGQENSLDCSIYGTGTAATMSCNSRSYDTGARWVYNVALVVGSNHVGYIVACGGGLLWRIGCQPLSVGQVLKGTVSGDKLTVQYGAKLKSYRVETSAYLGPLTDTPNAQGSLSSSEESPNSLSDGPNVRRTVQAEPDDSQNQGSRRNQPLLVTVAFSSEPNGAEIYIDRNFVGSTPSVLHLAPGSHQIEIRKNGLRPWIRTLSLSQGGNITVNANLTQP